LNCFPPSCFRISDGQSSSASGTAQESNVHAAYQADSETSESEVRADYEADSGTEWDSERDEDYIQVRENDGHVYPFGVRDPNGPYYSSASPRFSPMSDDSLEIQYSPTMTPFESWNLIDVDPPLPRFGTIFRWGSPLEGSDSDDDFCFLSDLKSFENDERDENDRSDVDSGDDDEAFAAAMKVYRH
jgi:hypothetical protein